MYILDVQKCYVERGRNEDKLISAGRKIEAAQIRIFVIRKGTCTVACEKFKN
jgi:hypothetical protein